MNIGLDLDGVLYDYHSALYREVTYFMGVTVSFDEFWTKEFHTYNETKINNLINLLHPYTTLVPSRKLIALLDRFAEKHELFYITCRPETTQLLTKEYLRKYKFPYRENLYFTENKTKECRFLSLDLYVEDMLKHAIPLSMFCTVFLVDKPWNRIDQLNKNIIRINSIYEMENILCQTM